MPVGLSYQCQKTVIRYIEANKRISLSSRCPSLQRIERLIPLQLNSLAYHDSAVIINWCNRQLAVSEDFFRNLVHVTPPGVNSETAKKKMVAAFLDQRKVYVKTIVVNSKPLYHENTKFHIGSLKYNIEGNIDLGYVDPSSYPLRQLACYVKHNDDCAKITRNLTILNKELTQRSLRLLTTQYFSSLTLQHFVLSGTQMGQVLEHWKAGNLKIGTKLIMHYDGSLEPYERRLAWLKQNFSGRTAFMILHCGSEVQVTTYECDSKSEIAIYATKDFSGGSVVMEIVPLRITYSLEDSVIF